MKQVNEVDAQELTAQYPEEEPDEEELRYRIKKFRRRLRVGVILEALTTVIAVVVFLLTEDMRLPMVLIDRWTPLMLLILLVTWILDLRLARYREDAPQEEAE